MIRSIKLLQNIGTFDSDNGAESLGLKRLSLIYADNGRGKTTLGAVLRSASTGDPIPIIERHRLGSQYPPKVVLDCEGEPSNVIFQDGTWNRTLSNLKIYDDVFVDENVHSGLNVEAQHRQNLHELILGDKGVTLNRHYQDAVSRIGQHNQDLAQKAKVIQYHLPGGLSVDEFCDLVEVPEIENRIEIVQRSVMVARNQDAVRSAPLFEVIELPEFDIQSINQILLTDLPGLDRVAEERVQAHIQTLGKDGESWVADGVQRGVEGNNEVCPFCGQDLTGVDLIDHYRAYFSEAYAKLKQDVADMLKSVDLTHSGDAQVSFERAAGKVKQTGLFWIQYCDVPPIEIDTEAIAAAWNTAREAVIELLTAKQVAPLERFEFSESQLNSFNKYNDAGQKIQSINEMLTVSNVAIGCIQQQASSANLEELLAELNKLEATKVRFSKEVAPLCLEYLREKNAKSVTETERTKFRKALEEYRENAFPELQKGINTYLRRFNTGYSIGSLKAANIGGGSGSTCTYNVIINDKPIAVRSSKSSQGKPSFRNSLSAGDRNTLALALFFSSLDQNPNLADTIVIIDDPMSSLDDHRSLATVQAIRDLAKRAGQVIVLSHNKRFLCDVWSGANTEECLALEIALAGGGKSTIHTWGISQESTTGHDQRHFLLREYAIDQSSNEKEVALAIRPHLEGFLRVVCPGSFPPEKLLGSFIADCRNKAGSPDEVLNKDAIQELDELRDYGNRFHHDTNPAWQTENVNTTELLGFVKRTLAFVRPQK